MIQHKPGNKTAQATGIATATVAATANKTGSNISNGDTHAIITVSATALAAATAGAQLYIYVLFDGETGGDSVDPAKAAIGSILASGGTVALVADFVADDLHGRDFTILVRNEWNQAATVSVTCETFSYGERR